MNAVILAVLVMVALSLARVSVVFALVVGALVGGLVGGLSLEQTLGAFNEGVGGGAQVALAYAGKSIDYAAGQRRGYDCASGASQNVAADGSTVSRHLFAKRYPGAYRLYTGADSAAINGDEPLKAGSSCGGMCAHLWFDGTLYVAAGRLWGDFS